MTESANLGAIERHSIDYVPAAERHGTVRQQAPFWFLGNTQFLLVAVGFIGPGMGLSLGWTLVATVVGILFGTIFMAFHASQGPDLGLPQMVQSRAQFGYRGVVVPLFGTLVMFLGYNIVDTLLLREGLHGIFGWAPLAVALGTAVIAVVLAIWGYDWVHLIFQVLFWISLPLLLVVTGAILLGHVAWPPPAPPGAGAAPVLLGWNWAAFGTQLATAAATNITWAPCVSDYTRYLPRNTSTRAIIFNVFLGAAGAGIWLIALGAWLAVKLNASDALVGLRDAGDAIVPYLGEAVALATVFALVATMAVNIYSGMLTMVTAVDSFVPVPRTRAIRIGFIAVFTVLWLAVALPLKADAIYALSNALPIMLYLLVPWTAVNLVDFFIIRRGHYAVLDLFSPHGVYHAWGTKGLVAYFLGFACSVPFFVLTGLYVGPLAQRLDGVDIAWLVGLVVSGGLYWLMSLSFDLAGERSAIAGSEARLAALDAAVPAE
jgi:NCS1 family nucleobase:cation symporter-1